jgi:hypothetical protein
MWPIKLVVCILYDIFDFTIGRVLFPVPFLGEIVGCGLCCMMFGVGGMLYALEAIDITEQFDGFVPAATLIAIKNRPSE